MVQDAKPSPKQMVVVYTDFIGKNDRAILSRFEKTTKINVQLHFIKSEEIIAQLHDEKYNSFADLIWLHGADQLLLAGKSHIFSELEKEVVPANLDSKYVSTNNYWCALSKSPMVIIFNKNNLNKDTIHFYNELLQKKWQGKIAIQNTDSPTLKALEISLNHLPSKKNKNFMYRFFKQHTGPKKGDDHYQIKRVSEASALLAIVELKSLLDERAQKDSLNLSSYRNVGVIFPGQTQKGTFFNVTGAGVYRYARNPENANLLLKYLYKKGSQYQFAAGRNEYPVMDKVHAGPNLFEFGYFRGRFLANSYTLKKARKN
jgi:iron(III) transport system substrate-binding protein